MEAPSELGRDICGDVCDTMVIILDSRLFIISTQDYKITKINKTCELLYKWKMLI